MFNIKQNDLFRVIGIIYWIVDSLAYFSTVTVLLDRGVEGGGGEALPKFGCVD